MLSKEIFTLEYMRGLQKRYKKDPGLLERVMYAFGLLEAYGYLVEAVRILEE